MLFVKNSLLLKFMTSFKLPKSAKVSLLYKVIKSANHCPSLSVLSWKEIIIPVEQRISNQRVALAVVHTPSAFLWCLLISPMSVVYPCMAAIVQCMCAIALCLICCFKFHSTLGIDTDMFISLFPYNNIICMYCMLETNEAWKKTLDCEFFIHNDFSKSRNQ